VVSQLNSRLEGRAFESHPIVDGNGVKVMPGLIPARNHPIQVNSIIEKKENTGSQIGHTKNFFIYIMTVVTSQ